MQTIIILRLYMFFFQLNRKQVMRTVLGYFMAYSPLIVAFAIAFHILMPGSRAFGWLWFLIIKPSFLENITKEATNTFSKSGISRMVSLRCWQCFWGSLTSSTWWLTTRPPTGWQRCSLPRSWSWYLVFCTIPNLYFAQLKICIRHSCILPRCWLWYFAYSYFAYFSKVLFAAFLVVMSIVLMNLVVGLAISDITALRSNSLSCL